MWGCRVVEACNGIEAVEAASRERPALILMDGSLLSSMGLAPLVAYVKTSLLTNFLLCADKRVPVSLDKRES